MLSFEQPADGAIITVILFLVLVIKQPTLFAIVSFSKHYGAFSASVSHLHHTRTDKLSLIVTPNHVRYNFKGVYTKKMTFSPLVTRYNFCTEQFPLAYGPFCGLRLHHGTRGTDKPCHSKAPTRHTRLTT